MLTRLVFLFLLMATPALAQEKLCLVENAYLYVVKQARDAAERRAAELAVQLQQISKEKQQLEKQLMDLKKAAE